MAEIAVPGHWGCSHCDVKNVSFENFRGTCKHIICGNCVVGVINRIKLFTKKASNRKAATSSVIEAICPCVKCRGTLHVSHSWYVAKNARVISLCDEDDQEQNDYFTAAVAEVKSEIKAETSADDQTVVLTSKKVSNIERGGLKPLFEKGDAVYAIWEESGKWFPGKILSYEVVDSKSRYGDVRKYSVKFDDGDVGSMDDFNVFHYEDYLVDKNDEGDWKWKWKGVKNVTDKRSSDSWAKVVGWYAVNIDGKTQNFSTLIGALRAYDASVIKMKGNQTKESDLNLPQEYRDKISLRKRDVNVATPSPLQLSSRNDDYGYNADYGYDDDESRFSDGVEQSMPKRIKLERDAKIQLPPQLEGDQNVDHFWSARESEIEFTEEAFKKKSIFHLNSFVDAKVKENKGFGMFVEQGIATPCFEAVPEDIVPMIADMTQNELREAIVQRIVWGCRFDNSRSSAAGQVAMWLKRVEVGSFVVMRHEYGKCRYTPDWLRERNEESGDMEYIGPVYIIGVVTRKIKPYSAEEDYVVSQMAGPIPNICLVDWRRMGTKADLKEETQKYINRICQPTVVNICNDFEKVYTDGATSDSVRQDLWDNSSPFEIVV
ncbi:hypothetical protein ACHAXM_000762 [Skeletonema potamos]